MEYEELSKLLVALTINLEKICDGYDAYDANKKSNLTEEKRGFSTLYLSKVQKNNKNRELHHTGYNSFFYLRLCRKLPLHLCVGVDV